MLRPALLRLVVFPATTPPTLNLPRLPDNRSSSTWISRTTRLPPAAARTLPLAAHTLRVAARIPQALPLTVLPLTALTAKMATAAGAAS